MRTLEDMNKKGVDLFILPLQWEPINAHFKQRSPSDTTLMISG